MDESDLSNNSADLLKGATFILTKYTNSNFNVVDTSSSDWPQTSADIKVGATYTLNGVFEFKGLPAGFYKLDESVMPEGYITMGDDPAFEVRLNAATTELEIVLYKKNGETYTEVPTSSTEIARIASSDTLFIANAPGAALPSAGGPGTTLFYLVGILMTAFAGAGILMKRRQKAA